MTFILKRIDKKKDSYTKLIFKSYDEAFDFLANHFGQSCCSDVDYETNEYYEIIKKVN